jgi:hypothetical protein
MARGRKLTDKHGAKDERNPRIREGYDRALIVINLLGHSVTSFGIRGERLRRKKHQGEEGSELQDYPLFLRNRHQAFRPRVLFLENAPAETL